MKQYKVYLINALLTVLIYSLFSVGTAYATTGCFPDTNGYWAETFICWLKDNAIASGYSDGTYGPGNNITRGEMAVFLQKIYNLADGSAQTKANTAETNAKAYADSLVNVPPSTGDIYINTGPSNWVVNGLSSPTASAVPFWAWTQLKASSNGTYLYSISPSLPSGLYNRKMYVKGAKLCYDASLAGAYITAVEIKHITYGSGGFSEWNSINDPTDLTDKGCRVVYFTTPRSFWGNDQVTLNVYVTFTNTSNIVLVGVTTVIISPSAESAVLKENELERLLIDEPVIDDITSGE